MEVYLISRLLLARDKDHPQTHLYSSAARPRERLELPQRVADGHLLDDDRILRRPPRQDERTGRPARYEPLFPATHIPTSHRDIAASPKLPDSFGPRRRKLRAVLGIHTVVTCWFGVAVGTKPKAV